MSTISVGEFRKLLPNFFIGVEGFDLSQNVQIGIYLDAIVVEFFESDVFVKRHHEIKDAPQAISLDANLNPVDSSLKDISGLIEVDLAQVAQFLDWAKQFKYKTPCSFKFFWEEKAVKVFVEEQAFLFHESPETTVFPPKWKDADGDCYLYFSNLPQFGQVVKNLDDSAPEESLLRGVLMCYDNNQGSVSYESVGSDRWMKVWNSPEGHDSYGSCLNLFLSPNVAKAMLRYLDKDSAIEFFIAGSHLRVTDKYGNEVISYFEQHPIEVEDISDFIKIWKYQKELMGSYNKPVNQVLPDLQKRTGEKYVGLESTDKREGFVDTKRACNFLKYLPPKLNVWVQVFEEGCQYTVRDDRTTSTLLLLKKDEFFESGDEKAVLKKLEEERQQMEVLKASSVASLLAQSGIAFAENICIE